jgi:hypothetical protein
MKRIFVYKHKIFFFYYYYYHHFVGARVSKTFFIRFIKQRYIFVFRTPSSVVYDDGATGILNILIYTISPLYIPPQMVVHGNNNDDDDDDDDDDNNIFSFRIHFNIMPPFGQIDAYN